MATLSTAMIRNQCLLSPDTLCDHPLCRQAHAEAALPSLRLAPLVEMQTSLLRQIAGQGNAMSALLARLGNSLGLNRTQTEREEESPQFLLWPSNTPKSPLVREVAFSITGLVTNQEGHTSPQASGLVLVIELHTSDSPPRQLSLNVSGKKVLRGTIAATVNEDGSWGFARIVVNEVSSHYTDDELTLVIGSQDKRVKPLVFRHLTVKSRRKQEVATSQP